MQYLGLLKGHVHSAATAISSDSSAESEYLDYSSRWFRAETWATVAGKLLVNSVRSLLEFQTTRVGFGAAPLYSTKVISSRFSGFPAPAAGETVVEPMVVGCLLLSYAACCLAGVGATWDCSNHWHHHPSLLILFSQHLPGPAAHWFTDNQKLLPCKSSNLFYYF